MKKGVKIKEYIGVKYIKAEPQTKERVQGYKVFYPQPNGSFYESWSPKEVFENSYKELGLMKAGK